MQAQQRRKSSSNEDYILRILISTVIYLYSIIQYLLLLSTRSKEIYNIYIYLYFFFNLKTALTILIKQTLLTGFEDEKYEYIIDKKWIYRNSNILLKRYLFLIYI